MDVGSPGSLVRSPPEGPVTLRDIVCKHRSGGIERIQCVEDAIRGSGELHLACNLQPNRTLLVIVLELDLTCTRSDLDRLAVVERDTGAGLHLGPGLRAYGGGATYGVVLVGLADLHLTHIPVPGADFGEPLREPGRVLIEAAAAVDRRNGHVALVVVAEVVGDRHFDAADFGPVTLLVVPEDRDHELHLLLGENPGLFREIIDLGLCTWGDVGVHTTDAGVARVDGFPTDDLADGLADLTDPLDPESNAPDRFFLGERVDLRIGPGDVHVREG